ncbi:MAG: nuclear transport factor 2 family protein [Flavobacterium sp.]|uniref:nuclear transport factor 2 family protein n=1 Tax=Flavobacterium sp. TaxID=239 RepID=UPI0012129965|nr:nuclear transport factor 2 family protein [Flavobacterium sp.]RZJ68319.1 MAG: nuclear transport factor 2 family protein [Flavobacterium sp.]
MNPHEQLIEEFYAAFAEHEAETMASCYHPEVTFSDPVFGKLHGKDAADMWRMLISRSKGNLVIEFSRISADNEKGSAKWVASYDFSKTNRKIVNHIEAKFTFKDGLIFTHDDHFDFYKWNRQAFGLTGWLLGNTSFLKDKVKRQALAALRKWQS